MASNVINCLSLAIEELEPCSLNVLNGFGLVVEELKTSILNVIDCLSLGIELLYTTLLKRGRNTFSRVSNWCESEGSRGQSEQRFVDWSRRCEGSVYLCGCAA
ncbi:hypothetical protein S7335_170 [Synechococcus sp. PCC 7335]|nr:hypothetical protein S7335_170 [Synechococcus sp. PCC 7335]